ncbi:MAG TPA: glycosyl hydrolase [Saprospirales bacterium]|nr:glycosyl hydrolase [Saprospirales bacterium]
MKTTIKYTLVLVLSSVFHFISGAQTSSEPSDYELYSTVNWRNLGPNRGGRSCAVAGVPEKPNLFYFGATGGGVWKTSDGGRSWDNISDGYFGGSIGSISVAPSDPNVIYVGGGEKTVRGNVSYGYGMWKSVNAGKTWQKSGLPNSRHISRIRIHPINPDIVFAAVMGDLYKDTSERGVYKSIDGGKTWRKVLYSNASSGAVDLLIDPTNHRIMYANTWTIRRTPYSLSSGGEGSAMYKSTDGGETWIDISKNEGLPSGTWGISGVAVSPLNGERVWAIIENDKGGVYRSDNGGETWNKLNDKRALRQRAWYYTRIYADTKDENTVYVMNVRYHKSTDGGKSFSANRAPHGDHHDLWIAPEDPNRMIIGDDGGAQVTYDGGETWSTYHNQPTSQFYRVTTDNHFPYRIYAAQQDNSTIRIAHRTTGWSISENDWEGTAGGESAHIAIDPEDNDIVYGGSYDGFLTRRNHRTGDIRAINVWPDNPMGHGAEGMKYRFQWNFPIFFSKHNPNRLYTASQHLHVTEDEGQTWKIISPDLTRNEAEKLISSGGPITQDNTSVEYYATIFAAAESPIKEGVIWVGSDDGRLHVTQDGGNNWVEITSSKMPKYLMINSIDPNPFDASSCYVAGTMYKSGDYKPYLFKTDNYGKSWTQITTGIPNDHFTRVLRSDKSQKGYLYAGGESGMYISRNDGKSWESLQLNMPIVPITDLAVKGDDLIAATQGRGLWMIDDLHILKQAEDKKEKGNFVYAPDISYRMSGSAPKDAKGAGVNHPGGVNIHFYLDQYDAKKDTFSISYLLGKDTIVTYSNHAEQKDFKLKDIKQGANKHRWNMRYPTAKKFDGMILWWGSTNGAMVAPGTYSAVVTINGKSKTTPFTIEKNPNSEQTSSDIEAQVAFVQSINDKVTEAHQAIIDIRSLRKQIGAYVSKTKNEDLAAESEKIDSIMTVVEEALYQTKNKSGQDPLNFPIRLTNKLAHLNSLTQMGTNDYPPTAAALAVRDELVASIDGHLITWQEVKTKMIPTFNQMVREKALDVIIIE